MGTKMTRKTILKSAATAALALLALVHGPARADMANFKALEGVEAEAMNAEEMEAVQGKAFLGAWWQGQYLMWQDDQFSYPFGFDASLPSVQQVFAWVQAGALPADPTTLYYFLSQADPQGLTRFAPGIGGCWTSMGPGIPGWTIGC
jgi:hypothetical protein